MDSSRRSQGCRRDMFVALTITPVMCLLLLKNVPIEHREQPLVTRLQHAYDKVLWPIIRHPRPVFITTGVVILIGLLIAPTLGESLFPTFKERNFLIHWITKPGTSAAEEERIAIQLSNELRSIPGVRNFGSHIGQALLGDEINGVNFGENWISVSEDANYDETLSAIENVVTSYPGLFHNVENYLNERMDEVISGSSQTFVVRIYGSDLKVIHAKAEEVEQALKDIPGIENLNIQLQSEVPQVQVVVDLAAARKYGVKPGDVRRASATFFAGEEVGDIFRNGKAYDVNVWSVPSARESFTSIRDMPIDTGYGGHVPMGEVADVSIKPAQSVIYRENASRRIDIGAEVKATDLSRVMATVEERVNKIQLPLGYRAVILGEYAERQAATNRLYLFGIVAAFG